MNQFPLGPTFHELQRGVDPEVAADIGYTIPDTDTRPYSADEVAAFDIGREESAALIPYHMEQAQANLRRIRSAIAENHNFGIARSSLDAEALDTQRDMADSN